MEKCHEYIQKLKEDIKLHRYRDMRKHVRDLRQLKKKHSNKDGQFEKWWKYDAEENEKKETVLMFAVRHDTDQDLIEEITDIYPEHLLTPREGPHYKGQTILHMFICNNKQTDIKFFFDQPIVQENLRKAMQSKAIGSKFDFTIMMGELPFSVAALTLNKDLVELILEETRDIHDLVLFRNRYGDTVVHSLIKYATLNSSKRNEIIEILKLLVDYCEKKETSLKKLWYTTNDIDQTPLQLATRLGLVDMFLFLLEIKDVYCHFDQHDGIFMVHRYDITEVEMATFQHWLDRKKTPAKAHLSPPARVEPERSLSETAEKEKQLCEYAKRKSKYDPKSILELVCELDGEKAFQFIDTEIVKYIIKKKWNTYKKIYFVWGGLHFLFMSLLTAYMFGKVGNIQNSNAQRDLFFPFLIMMSVVCVLVALLILGFEVRRNYKGHYLTKHLRQTHHNGMYRLILIVFALALFIDSVWYWISPTKNYFLIVAILSGWWFMTFFLRGIQTFSFFTVMLQEVILGDFVRFSVVIMIVFFSCAFSMHIVFISVKPAGFATIGDTIFTMFNLMIGLNDVAVLNEAEEPWLAMTLFVFFTLFAYLIMLNALIAMMSETCSRASKDRKIQWELQRLAVILFIESSLKQTHMVKCGEEMEINRLDQLEEHAAPDQRWLVEMALYKSQALNSNIRSYFVSIPKGNASKNRETTESMSLNENQASKYCMLNNSMVDESTSREKTEDLLNRPSRTRGMTYHGNRKATVRPSTSFEDNRKASDQEQPSWQTTHRNTQRHIHTQTHTTHTHARTDRRTQTDTHRTKRQDPRITQSADYAALEVRKPRSRRSYSDDSETDVTVSFTLDWPNSIQ